MLRSQDGSEDENRSGIFSKKAVVAIVVIKQARKTSDLKQSL